MSGRITMLHKRKVRRQILLRGAIVRTLRVRQAQAGAAVAGSPEAADSPEAPEPQAHGPLLLQVWQRESPRRVPIVPATAGGPAAPAAADHPAAAVAEAGNPILAVYPCPIISSLSPGGLAFTVCSDKQMREACSTKALGSSKRF